MNFSLSQSFTLIERSDDLHRRSVSQLNIPGPSSLLSVVSAFGACADLIIAQKQAEDYFPLCGQVSRPLNKRLTTTPSIESQRPLYFLSVVLTVDLKKNVSGALVSLFHFPQCLSNKIFFISTVSSGGITATDIFCPLMKEAQICKCTQASPTTGTVKLD